MDEQRVIVKIEWVVFKTQCIFLRTF